MKKLLLIITAALLLNGCRYINTEEKYVDAKESPVLTIPEGVDTPNSTATLNIPKAQSQEGVTDITNRTPPDMPIRTKQADDGKVRIENIAGFPVLTTQSTQDQVWQVMSKVTLDNWSVSNTDEEQCSVYLKYDDPAAREREESGAIKKFFTRAKYHSDYTGEYNLTCSNKGSVIEVKFSKNDGTTAKSFLADNVMNAIYDQLK